MSDTQAMTRTIDTGVSNRRFKILSIPGSLRRQSYNRGLLEAARQLAPVGVEIQIIDLAEIPHFNSDVEEQGDPAPVARLKEQIRRVDALLIAAPEYNSSIPGALKDALDWASRPPSEGVLRGKPVAIMSESPGRFGAVRGQRALRQILDHVGAQVLTVPEVLVAQAGELFNEAGILQDGETRVRIRLLVEALVTWSRSHQAELVAA
jgi:chromate reductase